MNTIFNDFLLLYVVIQIYNNYLETNNEADIKDTCILYKSFPNELRNPDLYWKHKHSIIIKFNKELFGIWPLRLL